MKQLLNKGRRLSINVDASLKELDDKQSEDELAQEFFKDSLFLAENRVVGLKRISIKDQRNITAKMVRTYDLPGTRFSLRVVELADLVSNGQAAELGKGSRFSKN